MPLRSASGATPEPVATAELQVSGVTADPAVAGGCPDGHDPALATGVCVRCGFDVYGYYDIPDPNAGRSDLDRHAEANAALAGFVRRAFIGGIR